MKNMPQSFSAGVSGAVDLTMWPVHNPVMPSGHATLRPGPSASVTRLATSSATSEQGLPLVYYSA